ncbi:hypothetical protein PBY51_018636 [Eleginops maclovinus]|uniref:Uncharacterized protein n=1 Tax=Eleginops maclovinus TaxID=56733 RepID=A0AAN7YAA1_ELEMC|nr:hypothetical protein PBY51_018636 [Eleginops maclovinus]
MEVTEKTPALNLRPTEGVKKKEESGEREVELADGRNTRRGNKLGETITYSDRPGGAVLLAARGVGPQRGPSYPRWMGLSLRTKLILGVE